MREDFDKYLANNKTYISDFDITKHIVLDNESNYWYSAEYVDKMLKKQDKEIERLNNIIKEVREYLTDEGVCILNKGKQENERLVWTWENYYDLLEILKGSDIE